MRVRELLQTKIKCARKFFDEIGRRINENREKYGVVTSYADLMPIVRIAAEGFLTIDLHRRHIIDLSCLE